MTNIALHAHIDTYAVDCDGPISNDYVMTPNDVEQADQFGDIMFHERVIGHVVNTYSLYMTGRLNVRRHADDSVTLNWSEATDEGSRSVDARICADPLCDTDERHYRDHRAESMGY